MKLIKYTSSIALLTFVIFIVTCKKNDAAKDGTGIAPIAIAGPDTTISLLSCNDTSGSVALNGNASYDPGHTQLTYKWKKIRGPETGHISNPNDAKAIFQSFGFGSYELELTVTNEAGKTSKDIMKLVAGSELSPFVLDLSLNSDYYFKDNYQDTYYLLYYDYTTFSNQVAIPGLGDFNVEFYENADTSNISEQHATSMNLYDYNGNDKFLSGECSINFKKVILTGGGPFSGTIEINNSSALLCDPLAMTKMSPLNISGTFDTTTKKVTINLKGTVLF